MLLEYRAVIIRPVLMPRNRQAVKWSGFKAQAGRRKRVGKIVNWGVTAAPTNK